MIQTPASPNRLVRSAKLPWWTWVLPLPIVHIATWLSIATDAGNGIALLYAPVAFGTVMLYWWGPRVLLGLYVGGALSMPLWGLPIQFGPLIALAPTLQVALGWWLFMRIGRGRYWLPTLADLIKFLTLGLIVPALGTGLLLATLVTSLVPDAVTGLWVNYVNSFFGDAVAHVVLAVPALVLLTPFLSRRGLTVDDPPSEFPTPARHQGWRAGLTVGGIFITVAGLVAGMPIEQSWIVCGLLMVVLALQFGFRIVVLGTSWTILFALASHFLSAHGQYGTPPPHDLLVTHASIVVFCAMSLLIGRAISDLRREAFAREQSQIALRQSERRFRLLFENMTAGFMLAKMIYDADGRPIDYCLLEVNPAFEELTDLKADQVVGKTIRQVLPAVEDYWIEAGGQVARSRQPQAFQNYSQDLGRHYDVWLFSPAPDQFASIFVDITKRRQAEQSRDRLMAELDHRVRNNMTAVFSLAEQTAESAENIDSFMKTFGARVQALAACHDLLSHSQWTGLPLAAAVVSVVEPFADSPARLKSSGPELALTPRAAPALCLSLHELATNAVKHGVWSHNGSGRVEVGWGQESAGHWAIDWIEQANAVTKPLNGRGQGLELIRGMIESDLGGSVRFEFHAEGLRCHIRLPNDPRLVRTVA